MNQHQNIHEAQLAVMEAVPYLQKTSSKELKYTFAAESDLIHKVRGAMVENGVTVSPIAVSHIGSVELTSKTGTRGSLVRFALTYRFAHSPSGTHIDVQTLGEAMDYGDKACNKAMTIGLKYALRQFLLIETGDDPDIVAHNRDASNAGWIETAVGKVEGCKDEKSLDAQMERFRGRDPNTGDPLFTEEQLGQLAALVERRRQQLRETAK